MKQTILQFCVVFFLGCFGASPEKTGLEGKTLPDFNLLLPDSLTWIKTSQSPFGKPIALFYLSPYCPYCRAQTKEIIENIDELESIQFYFITPFPFSAMKGYYKEFQLQKYKNISFGQDTANFGYQYFKMPGIPYIAIYGRDRKLNKTFMGKIYSNQLKKVAEE